MEDVESLLRWIVELLAEYGIDLAIVVAASVFTAVVKSEDKRKAKKLERWYFLMPFILSAAMCLFKTLMEFNYSVKFSVVRGFVLVVTWLYNSLIYGCLATGGYKLIQGFRKAAPAAGGK